MDNFRGLLDINRMVKILNARKGSCEERRRVWTKRLMKVFSDGSPMWMWREWRMTGLLRGSMQGSVLVVARWTGRGKGELRP